nr:alanine racemase [uncultured Peptostreptococcus sp.]
MKNAKLQIDLRAVYNNASRVLGETNGGLIAVVKNNAYNFGLERVVKTLYKAGVRAFATTSIKECVKMRKIYDDITIISLNPAKEFDLLREYRISTAIANLDFVKNNLEDMKGISWHLEWAGSMRRSGSRSKEEVLEILTLARDNNIDIEGIWTHFSWADEFDQDKTYEREREIWTDVLNAAKRVHNFRFIHAQNSASFSRDGLLEDHSHVRLGIYLYGCLPYKACHKKIDHAITLSARVLSIIHLEAGQSIGYCGSFVAKEPTDLAVINMGYGDGLLRSRIRGQDLEINKKRYPLVSLMMSHTVVIVDDSVGIGDEVYFYGHDIPVHEYTFKGVASNSEQISMLNHTSLDVDYLEIDG